MDAERLHYLLTHAKWSVEDYTWIEDIIQNNPEELYLQLGELLKEDTKNAANVPAHVSERLKKSLLEYVNEKDDGKTMNPVLRVEKNDFSGRKRKGNMKSPHWKKFIPAAAIILIIIATVIMADYFGGNKKIQSNNIAQIKSAILQENDTIFNRSGSARVAYLSDSTRVELLQGSYLYYRRNFSPDKKIVYLKGSAIFEVKKEANRPFSVYTESMEIRDLGTVFYVNNDKGILRVKLLKGKVLLHSIKESQVIKKDIFMKPGEVFSMDKISEKYQLFYPVVKKPEQKTTNAGRFKDNTVESMHFVNAPLDKVLDAVAGKFHLQINYTDSDLRNKSFTGDLSGLPGAEQILRIICVSNNLQYQINGNTVLIH